MTPRRQRFVTEYLVDLNASQAAFRGGYSARTAPQQGSRLLKNVEVQAAIAAKQTQQLAAVNVRVEDVLRDLSAIAHTELQTLSAQSGVPARWADKLKALVTPRITLTEPVSRRQIIRQRKHDPGLSYATNRGGGAIRDSPGNVAAPWGPDPLYVTGHLLLTAP